MQLYIANCSKQVMDFTYRVPGSDKMISEKIIVGAQKRVYRDASSSDLECIVQQHEMYGLVPVNEIDRTKGFIGACYQYDKPIDVEKVMRAATHNDDVLIEMGLEYRKSAAVAVSEQLNQSAEGKVSGVELEIIEDVRPGEDPDKAFNQRIEVTSAPRRGRGRPARDR